MVMHRDFEPLLLLGGGVDDGPQAALKGRGSTLDYAQRLQALDDLASDLARSGPGELARVPGLALFARFLTGANLTHLVARELPAPEALERFTRVDSRKSVRLLPRGMACHWTAGHMPLLGMFSWAISTLVGNRNVIRLGPRSIDVVSPLLRRMASLSGQGRELACETMVVQFGGDDAGLQQAMSRVADVRVIWGGSDVVDAVRPLPCDPACDTVVLGPRPHLAVVDPRVASDAAIARLVADILYLDQLACGPPPSLFLKGRPGDPAFDTVVAWMEREFERQSRRHADRGGWSVSTATDGGRMLRVVPFCDLAQVVSSMPQDVQTVVTLLGETELERFSEDAAARGACRFPAPGEGHQFETPWDGLSLISRLTRWVLRSETWTPPPDFSPNPGWTIKTPCSNN
jgi:hypothetical protein